MDRRLFLSGGAVGVVALTGCGSGSTPDSGPTRAPIPPDPDEVQHADVVFDGAVITDRYGNELTQEKLMEVTRAHVARAYIYIWDRKWGWHWRYMAYDTGHRYPWPFDGRPHLNFDVYYRWSDMQDDIREKTNKRTEYDGHFFVWKHSNTVICYRYDVSKDTKEPWALGTRYDRCTDLKKVATAAAVAVAIVVMIGLAVELAPLLTPAVALLGFA